MAKVETERFFGKKGIIIMMRDGNKMVSAIFKDKKNADKFNRNNPSDVKKLLQLAKKTKFPKAIDESVNEDSMDWEKNFKWANDKELKVISKFIFMNPKGISGVIKMSKHKPFAFRRTIQKMAKKGLHEASKEAMGIAAFTGTRGVAVDDFIKKNKIDARKLFNFVRKGNLRDRMDFVAAIAGKPNNKLFKMIVGRFAESINERARFGVVAKYGGYEMVEKSNQSAFIISKSGKTVGQLKRTSKYLKDDIKRFIKMVKDGKIKNVKSYKFIESVNESFFVMYQKKGVFGKPAAVKYKDKKTAEKFAKDLERDGYNTMILDRQTMRNVKGVKVTEAKNKESKAIQVMHKYSKTERKFYDKLADHERRIGPRDYKKFIEKALRGFGLNPSKFKTIPDAEEKMYQIAVKESISEDLRKWFGKGKTGSSTGGGWDRYGSDGQKLGKCGDGKKGGAYAACLSKEKAAKLGAKGRAAFVRRKRADQKKAGDSKKGGNRSKGKKPTFSKTGA